MRLGLIAATLGVGLSTGAVSAQQALPDGMLITCALRPLQEIAITSVVPGVVAEVFVQPGQRVEAGQPIIRLDTEFAESDAELARQRAEFITLLEAAAAREEALGKRAERLGRALENKAISQDQFETALLDYEQARADTARNQQENALAVSEYERARMVIEKSTIKSPTAGVIGEDLINPSESTNNQVVATLYVTDRLRAEAYVPLDLLPSVRNASEFGIVIAGDRNNAYETEIDYIAPLADLSSNTISVFFQIDGADVISGAKCGLEIK